MSLSDSCGSLPSLSHSITSTASSASVPINPIRTLGCPASLLRENEHLAVSLPPQLWKPDSATTTCDNLYCGAPFTLLNRRHHCRKCGGIFCDACTSRTTTLLDTAKLHFIQPPRHIPIKLFDSSQSRVVDSRVCNDCWDQIHGYPTTPYTPAAVQPNLQQTFSVPISKLRQPLANFFLSPKHIPFSLPSIIFSKWPHAAAPTNPPDASINDSPATTEERSTCSKHVTFALPSTTHHSELRAQPLRDTACTQSLDASNVPENYAPDVRKKSGLQSRALTSTSRFSQQLPGPPGPSSDPFEAYPLRLPSILCKANGGGRWVPKPLPFRESYSPPLPGFKAQWELDEEEEARQEFERKYRPNPLICDGPIKYRVPKEYEPEPRFFSRSPCRVEATY